MYRPHIVCLRYKFYMICDRVSLSWNSNCPKAQMHTLHTSLCITMSSIDTCKFWLVYISVYTACGDGIVRIFDAKSAALKRKLVGHELAVTSFKVTIWDIVSYNIYISNYFQLHIIFKIIGEYIVQYNVLITLFIV